MQRRYGLLILLSAVIVLAGGYRGFRLFHHSGLPFAVQFIDAHAGVIEPVAGIPLPAALHAGDRIDLAAQPRSTRIAIIANIPQGRTYAFVTGHGGAVVTLPVTSVSWNAKPGLPAAPWAGFCFTALLSMIALLAVWRGRDRAAAGLTLWTIANLTSLATGAVASDGMVGLGLMLGEWALFLLARVGFYVMAESMAGPAITPRAKAWWRASFLLLLGLGAIQSLGGPLAYVATGWAELLRPAYGFALTTSYLVPVTLLFVSYRRAEATRRLRLRWMLGSSAVFVAGVFIGNTSILGGLASLNTAQIMFTIALVGFLYAILRHRVVDFTVVLNHALVYAATTSFVLGLFALFESLIERTALGHGASLLLELAVPLGLGVSLSTVHRRIDSAVERFVFRRQYREEVALRGFARECAFVTQSQNLLDLTVDQIRLHVGTPWVALYEHTADGYVRVRQRGSHDLPAQVDADDLTLVKLRTHDTGVDLHDTPSQLGRDGHAFPLRVRGSLLGVLLVGPRPGEHYAAEERELLGHVAHEVGAALFALRAQATEEQLSAVRAQAQASEAMLNDVRAQAEARVLAIEERARASEALLLQLLPAAGSTAQS
ncbi:MAG: GAF domain-containing protein [Xanthomonadaceae bacterium]|nr:GAF domain-containing protein [Xanthomonadaceae bacterium]